MTQLLAAEGATLEQWAQHQGNYFARQLSFDLERALPPRVQAARYHEQLGLQTTSRLPMNLLVLQEHERGGQVLVAVPDADERLAALRRRGHLRSFR